METLSLIYVSFPELRLHRSDGHKIRGYFSTSWRHKSDLLHNHAPEGNSIYRYPLIQYKVVGKTPTIVGIGDGARILMEMFLNLDELVIQGESFPLTSKRIRSEKMKMGICPDYEVYQFLSPWIALNQENYRKWMRKEEIERLQMLKSLLVGNVLSFYKALGIWVDGQIKVGELQVDLVPTNFKNLEMVAFKGKFTINAIIPDLVGLGKSTSRGYGVVQKII